MSVDINNDITMHKRALAVFLAALMVATVFGIMGTAAGTPHGVANPEYARSAGGAPSHGATDGAIVHAADADGTSASGRCVLRVENASMVSPSELGVWVSVTYPASDRANVLRYIAFAATINRKPVEKTFNVTPYMTPGVRWGKTSGVGNEMFDAKGGLKPTTPLRINLTIEGVPRFTDNVKFTLTGTAFAGDGSRSEPSSIPVTIPLPVVIVEGLSSLYPPRFPDIFSAPGYYVSYKSFTNFMLNAGDGTFRYNTETNWSSYTSELQARGYSTQRYVTLWDPHAAFPDHPVIGYTTPQYATPDTIKADIDTIARGHVWPYSYASKCNLVGYSFGGLVARYYASIAPQNVSTVITLATPHAGNSQFYEWIYNDMDLTSLAPVYRYFFLNTLKSPNNDFVVSSRKEAEQMMAVPNTTTPSVLYWLVPTYNCLIPPGYQPVNPYFNNTLNAPPASGVKYYNIYVDGQQSLKTDYQISVRYVKDKNWYAITHITQENGDGVQLAKSEASFGDQYPTQVINQPVCVHCSHFFLLDNLVIQATVYRDLRM